MHSLTSFTVDQVTCRPPQIWEPSTVTVRPIVQLLPTGCYCDAEYGQIDAAMCLYLSADAYTWGSGEPFARFVPAGAS